jgi:hypothetical protein
MRRIILFLVFLFGPELSWCAQTVPGANATTEGKYEEVTLKNSWLKVRLYLPDSNKGYYRGTRFDWSGLISRVEFGNHTFFCEFKQEHDPLNHDDICGTAEEFGIESAPSYAQAGPGEPFIKIGIGVLERADKAEYQFWRRYKIQMPGEWRITRGADRIAFEQKLTGLKGWAYDFTKIIQLAADAPALKITRRLTNTGTETIDTDHYGHNFLRIDNVAEGTNYTLQFPFEPRFGTDSKTQGCLEIKGRSLVFTNNLAPDKAIWVRLEGFQKQEDHEIKVVNHLTGATMTITGDQPLSKLVLYSSGSVLCPEPFVKLKIPPGQTREWSTTYRFAAGTPDSGSGSFQPRDDRRPRTLAEAEGRLLKPNGDVPGRANK